MYHLKRYFFVNNLQEKLLPYLAVRDDGHDEEDGADEFGATYNARHGLRVYGVHCEEQAGDLGDRPADVAIRRVTGLVWRKHCRLFYSFHSIPFYSRIYVIDECDKKCTTCLGTKTRHSL